METNQNQITESNATRQGSTTSIDRAIQTGPKVRAIADDFEIRQVLLIVYAMVGLPADRYPTPVEDALLINSIRDKYRDYTLEEIKTAFLMATSRELDEELEVRHFNNFSLEYFGRIMAAYKTHRIEALKKMNQKQVTYTQPDLDLIQYYTQVLFEPYEKMMAGAEYPFSLLDGWMLYNNLHKLIELTQDERDAYRAEAYAITPMKKDGIGRPAETKEQHTARVTNVAKHLAFKQWIQEQAFAETDLRKLIIPLINQR